MPLIPSLSAPTWRRYFLLLFPALCIMPTVWGSVGEVMLILLFLSNFPKKSDFVLLWQQVSIRLFCLFMAMILCSALYWHNQEAWRGLESYKHLLVFPIYGVMLVQEFTNEENAITLVHAMLLIAASLMLIFLLTRYLTSAHHRQAVAWISFTRSTSLGVMLVFAIGVVAFHGSIPRFGRVLWALGAMFAILYILPSRTSMMCLAVVMVFLFFQLWQRHHNRLVRATIMITLVAVSLFSVFSPNGLPRFQAALTQEKDLNQADYLANYSANERKRYYSLAWQGIEAAPLLGQGVGQFTRWYNTASTKEVRYLHVHSQYLHTLFELGVLGLLLMLAWLFSAFNTQTPNRRYLRLLLTIFAVGTLFNSFLVGASEARFFMALLACYTFLSSPQPHNNEQRLKPA